MASGIIQQYHTPKQLESVPESVIPSGLKSAVVSWYLGVVEDQNQTPHVSDLIEFYREFYKEQFKETLVEIDEEDLEAMADRYYGTRDIEEMAERELRDQERQVIDFYSGLISAVYMELGLALVFSDDEAGLIDEIDLATSYGTKDEYLLGGQVPAFRAMHYSGAAYEHATGMYDYIEMDWGEAW